MTLNRRAQTASATCFLNQWRKCWKKLAWALRDTLRTTKTAESDLRSLFWCPPPSAWPDLSEEQIDDPSPEKDVRIERDIACESKSSPVE